MPDPPTTPDTLVPRSARQNATTPAAAPARPGLLTPAGWASMAAGVLLVVAVLGVAIVRRGATEAAPVPAAAASPLGLASAQATSAGGSTVYRQVDPMAIAAGNNPDLAAQMAHNSALAAARSPVAPVARASGFRAPHTGAGPRIEVEPAQGAGTVSQARGPAGGGSVVGRSDRGGPVFAKGPAQGTAVAPPAAPLPDSPKR